jgi:uncharacterized protein YkwD
MRMHRSAGGRVLTAALLTLAGLIAVGGFIDLFAKQPNHQNARRSQAPIDLKSAGLFSWSPPWPTPTPAVSWAEAAQNWAVAAWTLALTPTAPPVDDTSSTPVHDTAPADVNQPAVAPSYQPPPVPANESPPPGDYHNYDMAYSITSYVNDARASAGLGRLGQNGALSAAAQNYAQYLTDTNQFTHDALGGLLARVQTAGYRGGWVGEAIWEGWGNYGAADVVHDWLNSPSHRAILLGANYSEIGVDCYVADGPNTRCVLDVGAP